MAETAGSKSSTDSPQRIVLGRITGAHGLRGNLNVRYFGGAPDNLLACASVWLADSETDPNAPLYEVEGASVGRPNEVRMHLRGVDDRDAAEALKGRLVLVGVEQLTELDDDEYYSYQLIGCHVEHEDGRPIGIVTEIWSPGPSDLLVVKDGQGKQHLIPTAAGMLREVDIEQRRIVVEVLPGLIDGD